LTWPTSQPEMATTLKQKGMKVIRNERGWNKKLMINHTKAPFSHRAFRQALAYAIDRQEIIDKAHRGLATPASYGLLTVDHAMYNPNTPDYPHNPAKARELIESLGYAKGPADSIKRTARPWRWSFWPPTSPWRENGWPTATARSSRSICWRWV
jgi:peptide/nickel transport system substrate-binding protein